MSQMDKSIERDNASKESDDHTSAMDQDQNDAAPPSEATSARRPMFVAVALSIAWLLSWAGLVFISPDLFPPLQDLPGILGLIAGIASPLVLLWLITLVFQRSDPTLERRLALSQTLHKALAPVELAEDKLTSITLRLRRELDNIDALGTLADDRLANLENRFQDEASRLFSVSADTEAKAVQIAERLSQERKSIELLQEDIETRLTEIIGTLNEAQTSLATSTAKSQENAEISQKSLAASTTALETANGALSSQLKSYSKTFADRAEEMEQAGKSLARHAETSSSAVSNSVNTVDQLLSESTLQQELLRKSIEQYRYTFKEHISEAQTASNDLRETVKSDFASVLDEQKGLAEKFEQTLQELKRKISALETSTSESHKKLADDFNTTQARLTKSNNKNLDSIGQQFTAIKEQFERDIEGSKDHAADAAGQMGRDILSAKSIFDEAAQTLERQSQVFNSRLHETTEAWDKQLELLVKTGHGHLTGLVEKAAENRTQISDLLVQINDAMEESRALSTKTVAQMTSGTAETTQSLQQLQSHQGEALDQIKETMSLVDQQQAKLADQSDHMVQMIKEARAIASEGSHEFEAQLIALKDRVADEMDRFEKLTRKMQEQTALSTQELRETSVQFETQSSAIQGQQESFRENFSAASQELMITSQQIVQDFEKTKSFLQEATAEMDKVGEKTRAQHERLHKEIRIDLDETQSHYKTSFEGLAQQTINEFTTNLDKLSNQITQYQTLYGMAGAELERTSSQVSSVLEDEMTRLKEGMEIFTDRTAALEQKITKNSRDDFVRTSALLLDGLQSHAIDIHKLLAFDIPDTTWQDYTNGDRSIFARRTVKMIDKKTRKTISDRFHEDGEFREAASRYMQDFEALMERASIGDRGSAMQATLVSSDMGKLYVILGQSLKRFS